MSKVVIIDYSMGNLGSVRRAFEECSTGEVVVSDHSSALDSASHIILPGVGAFTKGMHHLKEGGWIDAIHAKAKEGIPLLGICLGMQLLADSGEEGGLTKGLGLIPGTVKKLIPTKELNRIPHVGWNEVLWEKDNDLSIDIPSGTDFYFVHSYHFGAEFSEHVLARTNYCEKIASIVNKDNVFGAQFHPEKSQRPGFQLIKNFLAVHHA